MKQALLILAISFFAACNENATTAEKSVDSSANATIDSLKTETGNDAVDSTKAGRDSVNSKL